MHTFHNQTAECGGVTPGDARFGDIGKIVRVEQRNRNIPTIDEGPMGDTSIVMHPGS